MPFPARYPYACAYCGRKAAKGEQSIFADYGGKRQMLHSACYYTWKSGTTLPTEATGDAATGDAPKPAHAPTVPEDSGLAAAIARAVADHLPSPEPTLDENRVLELVRTEMGAELAKLAKPTVVELVTPTGDHKTVGTAHKQFPLLLRAASAHCAATPVNIWLAGPAASGKTFAAQQLADALGRKFYFTGAIAEPYSLLGYNDAQGRCVRTPFREAYEHGGVFLWDEIDGSSPNALLAFNAALANGHCAFPDAVAPRHPDCLILAAANTYGHGATHEYVGRLKLDAATLSRFVVIDWGYDDALEAALCPDAEWLGRVRAVRANAARLGIKVCITPRASYTGARLLAAGIPQQQVEQMVLRSGATDMQWSQISATPAHVDKAVA